VTGAISAPAAREDMVRARLECRIFFSENSRSICLTGGGDEVGFPGLSSKSSVESSGDEGDGGGSRGSLSSGKEPVPRDSKSPAPVAGSFRVWKTVFFGK
jgi:hypothetical protein